jgi:hypothetical protein
MATDLRIGDLAITTDPNAGYSWRAPLSPLGADIIVKIVRLPDAPRLDVVEVVRFPLGDIIYSCSSGWLKLYWRPDAG